MVLTARGTRPDKAGTASCATTSVPGTLAFMADELPLTRDDVNALIVLLMRIEATVQELRDFLLEEDDDGEEEEEVDG